MKCKYCGKKIPDDASFCPFCGKRTETHLRAEDIDDDRDDQEYEGPGLGKRIAKAFISIIFAIIFVAVAFIAIMHFVKPYLGEEPWGDKKDEAVQEEKADAEEVREPLKIMYVSAEEGLVLRDGPSQDNKELHILNYGQEVPVMETRNNWAFTTVDGVDGWCSMEYLTEEAIAVDRTEKSPESDEDKGKLVEPATRIESGAKGVVNAEGGLNLRCGPGQDYDILLVVPYETQVVEEGRDGDWLFIKHDGQYGWVNSEFITPMQAD